MTSTTPKKRAALTETDPNSKKRTKTVNLKDCIICGLSVSSFLASPTTCAKKHGQAERACGECWEAYLSDQVKIKRAEELECMFCQSKLPGNALKRLARPTTGAVYDEKLRRSTKLKCQDRCKGADCVFQDHDREKDGRVFRCKDCSFQTCIDCDRPEHTDETCDQYQTRIYSNTSHSKAEAKTSEACRQCPDCTACFIVTTGCGHVRCDCGYRFCSDCLIPWVGEGSAYLGGRWAHKESCHYRGREEDSAHGLNKRSKMLDQEHEAKLEKQKRK